MRIRHFIIIPFIVLMLISGFASSDKGHLDNISIITCLEIASDETGTYQLRAELADTKGDDSGGSGESSGSSGGGSSVISSQGKSLSDAWKELCTLDSSIYAGHLRLILLDLDTAKKYGFEELSDFILSSEYLRFNTQIALYDAKAGNILDAETLISGNKGLDIGRNIRNTAAAKLNVNTEAYQVINSIGRKDRPLYFPVIAAVQTGERKIASVEDTAVFLNGRFVNRGKISRRTAENFTGPVQDIDSDNPVINSKTSDDRKEDTTI